MPVCKREQSRGPGAYSALSSGKYFAPANILSSGITPLSTSASYSVHIRIMASSTRVVVGYRIGEISQALVTKNTTKQSESNENEKLNALFSSASVIQAEFVPIIPKVRGHVFSGTPAYM